MVDRVIGGHDQSRFLNVYPKKERVTDVPPELESPTEGSSLALREKGFQSAGSKLQEGLK